MHLTRGRKAGLSLALRQMAAKAWGHIWCDVFVMLFCAWNQAIAGVLAYLFGS